jgi:hypothetical protein
MRLADWRARVAMAAHRADGHHEMLDFRLKGRHDFSPAALADQCRASTPMEIRPMIDEAEKRGHVERCAQVARRGASRDRSRLRAGGVLSYRSMDAVLQKLGVHYRYHAAGDVVEVRTPDGRCKATQRGGSWLLPLRLGREFLVSCLRYKR